MRKCLEHFRAARLDRQTGQLVLPLTTIATTTGFRAIPDGTLSYREPGPFLGFFRASSRDDALDVIPVRLQQAFGTTLSAAEAEWLAFIG